MQAEVESCSSKKDIFKTLPQMPILTFSVHGVLLTSINMFVI